MPTPELSRRRFLQGSVVAGITVSFVPLGSQAFAALFEQQVTASPKPWFNASGKAVARIDGVSKAAGCKVFARDIRAMDMPGWPKQQGHAMMIKALRTEHLFAGLDLSMLPRELQPQRVVTAADLARDGIAFPPGHHLEPLLPEGKVAMFIGHPVALLIWHDYDAFRKAKALLRFNDQVVRYGDKCPPYECDPYGSFRYVRVGGETPYDPDVFSSLKDSILYPLLRDRRPVWGAPKLHGDITQEGLYYADQLLHDLDSPPEDWEIFDARYTTQSIEPSALEPDNGNGWYDAKTSTLHFVVATQCPTDVAEYTAPMLADSSFAVEQLILHPGYTVGYGSKDNNIFVYYAVLAAMYGDGVPIRLANDRYEQFQSGIKRHAFDMHYRLAVNKKDHLFQIFRAHMDVNGGGRANYSASVASVGATAAQSIYYFPRSDLAATAYHTIAVEAGSMRGYGTLQTMAATEMMVDELAERLGVDAIELRKKNALKSGMKNTQGAIPAGALRLEEILDKVAKNELWLKRNELKLQADAEDVDNLYGVGFAICQKDFGTGAEAPMASVELSPDGHISLRQIAIDMGTGTATSQALLVAEFLGVPATEIRTGETQWPELAMTSSGSPYTITQEEQDQALRNPRWVGRLSSPSSATNSAYYSGHATREAARLLFRHGLWPAAMAIWTQGIYGGVANPYVVRMEDANWVEGKLTADGMPPIPLSVLAEKAHQMGLVTGVSVHGFNRWSWARADFEINGQRDSVPLDALAVKYGEGAAPELKAKMNHHGYHLLDRVSVDYPDVQLNNATVTYYSPVATIVELKVNKGTGEVKVLNHHSWLECGRVIVEELVSGQIQGGIAMGIGHALLEQMPLYEDGPGNGTWNFNRYILPRAKDCAVWTQTAEILPPLSASDQNKGIAEVVMIPIVGAIVNAVAHATGKRLRDLPLSPARIKEALNG